MAARRILFSETAAIFAGGVLGAWLRVGLSELSPFDPDRWPWATFGANLAGALLIGVLWGLVEAGSPGRLRHPFLATGFCGALTTFSAFQLEVVEMARAGEAALAAGYLGASLAAGLCLAGIGLRLGRTGAGR
jgi:CrcB protein